MSIRVVLGEDNVLVREGVRALLDSYDDIEVVGVAEDAPHPARRGRGAPARRRGDRHQDAAELPARGHRLRARDPQVAPGHRRRGALGARRRGVRAGAPRRRPQRARVPAEGPDRAGRRAGPRDPRGRMRAAARSTRPSPSASRAGTRPPRTTASILDLMAQGLGYEEMAAALATTQEAVDRRVTELFARMAAESGAGGAQAVDEMKRLHAAVVESSSTADALRSYVPSQVAERLADGDMLQQELEVTVLFSDIRGFSTIAERLSAREIADVVGRHLSAMAEVVADARRHHRQVPGRRRDGDLRRPRPAARPRRARPAVRDRDAGPPGRAERAGVGDRERRRAGRRDRREHGPGDRRRDRRRRAPRVHGDRRRRERRAAAAVRGRGRRDRGVGRPPWPRRRDVAAEPIGPRHVKGREEPVEVFRVVIV